MKRIFNLAVAIALLTSLAKFAHAQTFKVQKFSIGGDGGTDYLTAEPGTVRVFVSRGSHVLQPGRHALASHGRERHREWRQALCRFVAAISAGADLHRSDRPADDLSMERRVGAAAMRPWRAQVARLKTAA